MCTDFSDLVGVAELADVLGVTKSRVNQLRVRDDFPRPLFRLRATPVWSRSAVNAFQDDRAAKDSRIRLPSPEGLR